ncbi:copper amine oxidase N-terminal domain-containing protein [Deinococcus sp.]|uniref:copper amine oxidase N-terminal domain-containing protein n=1 Tax=Deinococcus sp. TaxID=47478 RepID=UPI003B58E28E
MRSRLLSFTLLPALIAALLAGPAQAASATQLQARTDQTAALLNGGPLTLVSPPRLIEGRTLLPLRETVTLLGRTLVADGTRLQLGRLSLDNLSLETRLDNTPQSPGSAAMFEGVLYINARLLAEALGANLSFADNSRSLTLTALPLGGNPLAPQARFSTDKGEYAPGEKVVYTEYAFDPDGADIVSRKWTGRQEAYFQPGTYTVALQVINSRGLTSTAYTRTIKVGGASVDNPLSYALKYAEPGERFPDASINSYPLISAVAGEGPSTPLIFSNSPEAPSQSGLLYQDSFSGRARVLAYHLNALPQAARLYLVVRNLEAGPVTVRTERLGETAPTRIESVLGQVTLLDYFSQPNLAQPNLTQSGAPDLTLAAGQSMVLYASPVLSPGSGVNLLEDMLASGRVELTFALLEDGLPPTAQVLQQLPYLPTDGKHQRGTFPSAVRVIRANLTALPARLLIGDGQIDPAVIGQDALSGQSVRLSGNYGVLYDIQINGASGVAVALSPRGGLYRGAMNVQDGLFSQVVKLPRSGAALTPNEPTLLWRSQSDQLKIDFVPASGSNLPISLVFYRARQPGTLDALSGLFKTYRP